MNPLRTTPNPHLLEIAVRPWLRRFSPAGSPPSLDAVPDAVLDGFRADGFHAVWLMGVWRTGAEGRRLALQHPELRAAYSKLLPGWTDDDIGGSPYSVQAYDAAGVGGGESLARFRSRLRERGLGLVLDFVPNHLACDHPWTTEHSEHLVTGTAEDLAREPQSWFEVPCAGGAKRIFAHGRDPHFAGWTDTVQVDHRRAGARRAMSRIFAGLAAQCDGLRCDVAMLVLEDVFRRTWGEAAEPEPGDFWSEAIAELRGAGHDTVLVAEAYWGLEARLIALGFDFAYDKGLYDELLATNVEAVRARLRAPGLDRGVHFLENHDEERAATTFGPERVRAAASLAFSLPGMRFFHDGQAEGRRLRLPVQLARDPGEPVQQDSVDFHRRLWRILSGEAFHRGTWTALEVRPAGPDAPSPPLVGSVWTQRREVHVVIANLSAAPAAGRVSLDLGGGEAPATLIDEMDGSSFERSWSESREAVSLLELPPWGARFLRASGAG